MSIKVTNQQAVLTARRAERTDDMKFEELALKVAEYFKEAMDDGNFDTFQEMQACYWWTINDIKDEVDAVLRSETDEDAYIDELDRTDVFNHTEGKEEMISYRVFANMWRKALHRLNQKKGVQWK